MHVAVHTVDDGVKSTAFGHAMSFTRGSPCVFLMIVREGYRWTREVLGHLQKFNAC